MVSPGCHIKLTKYAFTAGEDRMASGMPFTSRLGITLVKSEPGPKVITSASAMAVSAAVSGGALRGRSRMDRMRWRLALIRVSPMTVAPLANLASSDTLALVDG